MTTSIIDLRSPGFVRDIAYWQTWREAVAADADYVEAQLIRQPGESLKEFKNRKACTPHPAYIGATLREILVNIYTHMDSVIRTGGANSFQAAIHGRGNGVDGAGTSLNYFMVMLVLRELLMMRRVGVFVDRHPLPPGATRQDAADNPPYMYVYTAEQILAWALRPGHMVPDEILLRREVPVYLENTQLVTTMTTEYVHGYMSREPSEVIFDIYNQTGEQTARYTQTFPTLPFVLLEIPESIVAPVLGHQAALLNLGSSNIAFAMASNLAVYTEQTDMAWLMAQLRQAELTQNDLDSADSTDSNANVASQVKVGLNYGRRYAQHTDRPEFIVPDNENLERTQKLYTLLREDIRQLMLLTVESLTSRGQLTATSLIQSQAAVSNGLTALAGILERVEVQLSRMWSDYEDEPHTFAVKYPREFHVLTPADRNAQVAALNDQRKLVPSRTFQELVTLRIAQMVLGPQIAAEEKTEIQTQISQAPILTSDPDVLNQLVDAGTCPREYAAQALTLPTDAAEKANTEHADRLARIAAAQSDAAGASTARGNSDGADDSKLEKQTSQAADNNAGSGRRGRK